MRGIVAYTFLNVCEKIHLFLSSTKKDAHKRKLFPFSASQCTFILPGFIVLCFSVLA